MAKKGGKISGNGPTYGAVVDEKGFVSFHVKFYDKKPEHSHIFLIYRSGKAEEAQKWKTGYPIGDNFFSMGS